MAVINNEQNNTGEVKSLIFIFFSWLFTNRYTLGIQLFQLTLSDQSIIL